MRKKVKVSVVIPNWNGHSLLVKNLPKVIGAKKHKGNKIIEIIVVDDGSTDNSVELLNGKFGKDVRVVVHKKNRGFSYAVNTGVRFAKGTHICLLNTDVVPKKNFLVHTVGLLGSDVFGVGLHETGYGPSCGVFDGYFKHANAGELQHVAESLWVSGGSGLFSKHIWKELRGMDSELLSPFYWEDVDLGYRAHKRGYKVLWDPSANVEHRHESVINLSNFKRQYLNVIKERNELLFIWKNITSKNLTKKHMMALADRLLHHPGYIKVVAAALLKWRVVSQRRSREKAESTVSDEAVFAKFENLGSI